MSTQNPTSTDLEGRTVYASDGAKLGTVDSILTDERGAPEYVEVRSGWFGTRRHTVPIRGMQRSGDDLTLPYSKEILESAPTFEEHEHIDYDRERALGTHYGTEVRAWDDARDNWLAGEDLSRGPTPETRHPEGYHEGGDKDEAGAMGETGGLDDVRDTTQGPTPETRRVMRATDEDPAAAMQPESDAPTRGDVGGNQDLDSDVDDDLGRARGRAAGAERIRLRRWDRGEQPIR